MKVRSLEQAFGAEIYDVDVSKISDDELRQAKQIQDENGVVFFRDQNLTCDQHIEFAERWGEIVVNRFFERVEGYEQIAMVRKEPKHNTVVGETWHTDHSYDQIPARGSILYAREVPSQGGDTHFASMYMAYEALSDGLKETLSGLRAEHSSRHVFSKQALDGNRDFEEDRFMNHSQALQDSVHPVVIVHPESGKKALYVNPDFTVKFEGWSQQESQPLLDYLYAHSVQPQFVLKYQWHKDAIAFCDNRAVMHQAQNDYPRERRIMHRITLQGCEIHG